MVSTGERFRILEIDADLPDDLTHVDRNPLQLSGACVNSDAAQNTPLASTE
jgi:hypothetical protein